MGRLKVSDRARKKLADRYGDRNLKIMLARYLFDVPMEQLGEEIGANDFTVCQMFINYFGRGYSQIARGGWFQQLRLFVYSLELTDEQIYQAAVWVADHLDQLIRLSTNPEFPFKSEHCKAIIAEMNPPFPIDGRYPIANLESFMQEQFKRKQVKKFTPEQCHQILRDYASLCDNMNETPEYSQITV
jgi:hypothetical protein